MILDSWTILDVLQLRKLIYKNLLDCSVINALTSSSSKLTPIWNKNYRKIYANNVLNKVYLPNKNCKKLSRKLNLNHQKYKWLWVKNRSPPMLKTKSQRKVELNFLITGFKFRNSMRFRNAWAVKIQYLIGKTSQSTNKLSYAKNVQYLRWELTLNLKEMLEKNLKTNKI